MKSFKISKASLSLGEFSAFNEIEKTSKEGTTLFVQGRLYNTTSSDILQNYLKNGFSGLKSIDGDFLLIFIENEKITFFRDRHGAGSQLFYSDDFYASHLISFTELKDFTCQPDIDALFTFLSIGYIPAPQTALKGVSKLPAGHLLVVEKNKTVVTDMFSFDDFKAKNATTKLTLEEATTKYEELHKHSISNRIEGKKKVGLLLSGGYDSGGNISALRDIYQGDVVSYSIGFKNNPWTELPLAKILSERYNTKHFEYEIDGSEIMSLPDILKSTGDPFQEGGLMVNYTAMRLVKQSGERPEIILGGDGNDQHFGTSGLELALHWKLKTKGFNGFQKLYDSISSGLPVFEKDNMFFRTKFHNKKILYVQQSDIFGFQQNQLKKLSNIGFSVKQFAYLKNQTQKFDSFNDFYFNRNFNVDIKQVINNVILYKSSRMSELFENNMTFPYMSTELYDFLSEMPVEYKFRGSLDELSKGKGKSKFLHKNYLKPKLPTEITDRKKQGGFAPLPIFIKDDNQRKILFEYIRKSALVKQLFNAESINNILTEYDLITQSKPYWFWFTQVKANRIVNLLTLTVWWDMYVEKKSQNGDIKDLM
jgi:asparagine synthase (glutamine-hydrolysing)